jgi:hypothetical protein
MANFGHPSLQQKAIFPSQNQKNTIKYLDTFVLLSVLDFSPKKNLAVSVGELTMK